MRSQSIEVIETGWSINWFDIIIQLIAFGLLVCAIVFAVKLIKKIWKRLN